MDDYCFDNDRRPVFRVIKRGNQIKMSAGYCEMQLDDAPFDYFVDLFNYVTCNIDYRYNEHTKDMDTVQNAKVCVLCHYLSEELGKSEQFNGYDFKYDTLRILCYINLYGRNKFWNYTDVFYFEFDDVKDAKKLLGWGVNEKLDILFTDEMIELTKILLLQSEERRWKIAYRDYEKSLNNENNTDE